MEHTYEELSKKTVAQLRAIAKKLEHDALRGYTTMHKEHLLPALCQALGIEAHVHHEVTGVNKAKIKGQIRELKEKRTQALEDRDHQELKKIRREIHRRKRQLRRAMT